MSDRETSRFNINSKHHDKPKFALKLIKLRTVYNLYPLEVYKNTDIANFVC